MNIKIQILLSFIFFGGMYLNATSQDTITLYLDNDFVTTKTENAKFIREVVISNNHYYVTDSELNGKMVNYGEYKSVNPWIEDGLSIHYDSEGNKYSSGLYLDGNLVGDWTYYSNDKIDTVNYDFDMSTFFTVNCEKINIVKKKKQLNQLASIHVDSITCFINRNFHFPARTKSQIEYFTQIVNLVIDSDGMVKCPEIVNYLDKDLSLEIFRILHQYTSEIEVSNPISISITFEVKEVSSKDDHNIFTIVENMPKFTYFDCNSTFKCVNKYISDSLRFPYDTCSGKVIINLIVEPDGKISNIKILKGIDNCLDYVEELERLFKSMPAWIPGKQRGKAVRVRQNIIVNFKQNY